MYSSVPYGIHVLISRLCIVRTQIHVFKIDDTSIFAAMAPLFLFCMCPFSTSISNLSQQRITITGINGEFGPAGGSIFDKNYDLICTDYTHLLAMYRNN